jgi:hypothetical protein
MKAPKPGTVRLVVMNNDEYLTINRDGHPDWTLSPLRALVYDADRADVARYDAARMDGRATRETWCHDGGRILADLGSSRC